MKDMDYIFPDHSDRFDPNRVIDSNRLSAKLWKFSVFNEHNLCVENTDNAGKRVFRAAGIYRKISQSNKDSTSGINKLKRRFTKED